MKFPGTQKLSLRIALVVYVVAPLATAFALVGYMTLWIWEGQVETRMKRDLEVVARAIQLPLSHAMERDRAGGVEQALESAFSIGSVYSVYAYDLEGGVIASAGRSDPGTKRERLTDIALDGKRTGEYERIGERRVYSYFVPLKDSRDQTSGLLRLTRREKDFQNYLHNVRLHALFWFGLAVLVMSMLVLLGQHQALGRHFQSFVTGMRRISSGDYQYRIPLSGPKEIASIAASFNSMLDSIQNAEEEIRRNRREQFVLEDKLRQSEKLAALGQLAAGVAHELGTPLGTISGIAQRGQRKGTRGSVSDVLFERIKRETSRMEVIIRQLLDFSHRRQLKYRLLRPSEVAKSALSAVAGEAERRSARLRIAGGADTVEFSADPVRIEQALVNLLRNAMQAGAHVTVSLGWREYQEHIVFFVDDSGPGIPKEIRPRLFEPFFTTRNVGEGTGLGLAVVHGIASEHNGRVEVGKSDLGGARMELYLPARGTGKDDEL